MQIEKTFNVAAPLDRVWAFITSPEQVGPCMPGCQHVEVTGPGSYRAVISIKMGPIKTTINFQINTVEERPPEYALFSVKGEEGGSASRVTAENALTLKAIDKDNTEVTYVSKVIVVGRLGKFAGGVMQKMAEHMSDQFITAFCARVEVEPAAQAEGIAAKSAQPAGLLATLARWLRHPIAPILNWFGRTRSP